jgi:polyribonucleotide nucleotidyltransferase
MQTKKCDICSFETDNKKIFANHIRWKHKEKHFSEEGLAKIKQIKVFKVQKNCLCYRCNKSFVKEMYERDWSKIELQQNGRVYCSIKCANSRQHTEQEIEKITNSLKNFYKDKTKPLKENICKTCEKIFFHKLNRKTCSKQCYKQFRKR